MNERLYTIPGKIGYFFKNIVMILVSLCYVFPLYILAIDSLKSKTEFNAWDFKLPSKPQFNNYYHVITEGGVLLSFFNGLLFSVSVCVLTTLLTSVAAFYLSRMESSRLSKIAFKVFISGIIIPPSIIPTFLLMYKLHLTNTYHGFIIIMSSFAIPTGIFLYTGFIKAIPRELDEAAIVDGASSLKAFLKIVFPLLNPITITILVFVFLGVWNDAMMQLYFLSEEKWMMGLTIFTFMGHYVKSMHLVFADIVLCMIPCLALYLGGQKYIVAGLTAGAVKG